MIRTKEEMKAEAVKRMQMLDIFDQYIDSFKKGERIQVTEPPLGGLYWVEAEVDKEIKEIEADGKYLVYLVVRSFTNIGTMDAFLYVYNDDEDWQYDHDDIKEGMVIACVKNRELNCEDWGGIGVKPLNGGLIRTW